MNRNLNNYAYILDSTIKKINTLLDDIQGDLKEMNNNMAFDDNCSEFNTKISKDIYNVQGINEKALHLSELLKSYKNSESEDYK